MPFADYLAGGVLNPLHMTGTSLVPDSSPASGAQGPLSDLLSLAAELLVPTILSTPTLAAATEVAFPGLRGVLPGYGRFDPCDWGLGFEVKGTKHPHWTGTQTSTETFGHFGRAGGFLWVDPVAGLACATLSNREFGPWAVDEWSALADAVVEEWTSQPGARVDAIDALETRRHDREAAQREPERRAQEAAQAEAAETERRAQEAAHAEAVAEAAETERRAQEAALAEFWRRNAADADRRESREAARAAEAQTESSLREAARAERRDRESRAPTTNGGKHTKKAPEADLRVAAMTERRDEVVTHLPDAEPTATTSDDVGPLGPGIRPADFWGG
jgi:hypothetical protein